MSATLDDKLERSFTEQLAEFDGKLREQDDNAELLAEVHAAITDLIAENDGRDDEIREILQKRYNGGKLRLETYTLVRNVLDRVVIESMPTMPDAVDDEPGDDAWNRTSVAESSRPDEESPHERLQVGSVLRDRFLLQERVAGGSMGIVYKALDRRIAEADGVDPWVAIKVLSPKLSRNAHALRALQQEAAKGRCLSHPNIVRFIDLDRDDDTYYLVMEWLEGRSLAAILDDSRNQSVDRATALDIVRQVGLALDYAHRCGVVHADVKPANIMILPSGQVKLFDFGIARIRQKQHSTRREFDPGVLGAVTPAYSSMQVLTGEDPQPSDDVFSLGCLMYRLVAGHRVFGPRNAAEAADRGMEPQRPHGLSDAQWRALKKALAYARVSRFETPAEFLAALEGDDDMPAVTAALHTDAVHPHEPRAHEVQQPFVVEPKPPAPRPRRRWGLALLLLVVLGGAVAIALRPDLLERGRTAVNSLVGRLTASLENDTQNPVEADPVEEDPMAGNPFAQPGEGVPEDEGEEPAGASAPAEGEAGTAPAGTDAAPGRSGGQAARQEPGPGAGAAPQGAAGTPEPGSPSAGDDITRPLPSYEEQAGGQASGPVEPDTQPATPGAAATGTPDTRPATPGATTATPQLPATLTVPIDAARSARPEFDLTLREDAEAAVVELVRQGGIREPLAVLIEEVSFSGNRSPLTTGRYRLSSHMARFEAGQASTSFTITMSSDSLREADRQATLLVRNAANSTSRFAILNLTLQDDDQRAFEADLARDTIGFSESRIFVGEESPAVQVDVLRFNPGETELAVRYRIGGGNATEGEDYFVPGATGLVFGPSQRAARLLIPIVQDSDAEGEESFTLELVTGDAGVQPNVYRQITVVIGDDDVPF